MMIMLYMMKGRAAAIGVFRNALLTGGNSSSRLASRLEPMRAYGAAKSK